LGFQAQTGENFRNPDLPLPKLPPSQSGVVCLGMRSAQENAGVAKSQVKFT